MQQNLKDIKNRKLKIGERVRVEKNIPSPNGMLYKNTIVKVDEFNQKNKTIRVTDGLGKIWWINPSDVSDVEEDKIQPRVGFIQGDSFA